MTHPCLRCGACCAVFRVAFHWSETDACVADGVPHDLTVNIDQHKVALRGTEGRAPHCVALRGVVGQRTSCAIYAKRPSPCRELHAAWENGAPSPQCDRARRAYGLPVLRAEHWMNCED